MKIRLLLLTILSSSAFNAIMAVPPSFIQTKNGVIVFTDPVFTGTLASSNIMAACSTKGRQSVTIPLLSFRKNDATPGEGKRAPVASISGLLGSTGRAPCWFICIIMVLRQQQQALKLPLIISG